MKNYEDITNNLLKRRDEYVTAQKRKRRTVMTAVTTVVCLGIVLVGIRQIGKITAVTNSQPESVQGLLPVEPEPDDDSKIIWNDYFGSEDAALMDWNGKCVQMSLGEAFRKNPETSCYAIVARPHLDEKYVYNGKSLEEYESEAQYEATYPELLASLLKVGDALKYGEKLYQTGTPDGEKWSKEFYDKTVEEYGQELLSKYIVDGEFLREEVENDIKNYQVTKAIEACQNAKRAYYQQTLEKARQELKHQAINCEYGNDSECLVIYVTKSEFEDMHLEDISKWYFYMAAKNSVEDIPTDQ